VSACLEMQAPRTPPWAQPCPWLAASALSRMCTPCTPGTQLAHPLPPASCCGAGSRHAAGTRRSVLGTSSRCAGSGAGRRSRPRSSAARSRAATCTSRRARWRVRSSSRRPSARRHPGWPSRQAALRGAALYCAVVCCDGRGRAHAQAHAVARGLRGRVRGWAHTSRRMGGGLTGVKCCPADKRVLAEG